MITNYLDVQQWFANMLGAQAAFLSLYKFENAINELDMAPTDATLDLVFIVSTGDYA